MIAIPIALEVWGCDNTVSGIFLLRNTRGRGHDCHIFSCMFILQDIIVLPTQMQYHSKHGLITQMSTILTKETNDLSAHVSSVDVFLADVIVVLWTKTHHLPSILFVFRGPKRDIFPSVLIYDDKQQPTPLPKLKVASPGSQQMLRLLLPYRCSLFSPSTSDINVHWLWYQSMSTEARVWAPRQSNIQGKLCDY